MAPHRHPADETHSDEKFKVDRKVRKPLVEKQRRARINESLQELRALADDLQSKMENAEVLELTVRRVESILQNRAQADTVSEQEARERFSAGYIQCMHEVHSFVSSCPGIEPGIADDLLNHLLESMPLHEEDGLRVNTLSDLGPVDGSPNSSSTWSPDSPQSGWASPRSPGSSALSPAPSSSSSSSSSSSIDDLCSDLEETDSEQSHLYTQEGEHQDVSIVQYVSYSKSMWRPW